MNRHAASLCALVSAIALVSGALAAPARATTATFVVNSADDVDDGTCDATHCSLREAINAANANPGTDTIIFNISGVPSIKPTTALPVITGPVVIDGTTQSGFIGSPIVEIDGSLAGSGASGLRITAGASTVRALVINSFAANGILISVAGGNTVVGSFIGTDVTGTTARGNGGEQPTSDSSGFGGVRIVGVSGNKIGGTVPADRNVIAGNARNGVTLIAGASANVIAGNYIGLDVTGAKALSQEAGITIVDSPSNSVGGTTPGSRNVISDNGTEIWIEGLASTGNVVAGNYLGTDATGSFRPVGSFSGRGILILDAPGNLIGGTSAAARNVVSGHLYRGIAIGLPGAAGNLVQGNFIGTDATGTTSIPNMDNSLGLGGGILISEAPNNTIGGLVAGARNVISGNGSNGIALTNSNAGPATGNLIQGNFIGTDVTGTKPLGNFPFDAGTGQGIVLGGTGNTVGGTSAAARNVIAANSGPGIEIRGDGNVVQGNYVGTDVTGTVALGNGANPYLGDLGGVRVIGHNNQLGGTTQATRNVISGNRGGGVVFGTWSAITASGNLVEGNFIGPDATGSGTLGNQGDGVRTGDFSPSNNTIGGTVAGSGNVIRGNSANGVVIVCCATGDAILGNSVSGNGQIGIDLSLPGTLNGDGVTPNDPGDADTGGNDLQNFPVLSAATSGAAGTVVKGTLNSHAATTYRVELFASAACDPSGYGEGETFLGATSVTTDTSGNGSFEAHLTMPVAAGQVATATATDPVGNTSEFSACVPVRSASQGIADVIGEIGNTGLSQGNKNSLTAKLQAAQSSLAAGNTTAACNQLDAFSNEVQAKLKSGALTTQEAKALLDSIMEVKTVIGCP